MLWLGRCRAGCCSPLLSLLYPHLLHRCGLQVSLICTHPQTKHRQPSAGEVCSLCNRSRARLLSSISSGKLSWGPVLPEQNGSLEMEPDGKPTTSFPALHVGRQPFPKERAEGWVLSGALKTSAGLWGPFSWDTPDTRYGQGATSGCRRTVP